MIVMLHGWGSTPNVWSALQACLGSENVLTPDCHPPALSMEAWADAMAPSLPAQCVLVGWSLGAMLAMSIAARHPRKIDRLILIAATPSFIQRNDWPHALDSATLKSFRSSFSTDPARTLQRFIALQALGDQCRKDVIDGLQASCASPELHRVALAHGLRLLAETELRFTLPDVSMRCLFIHGEHDALMPPAAQSWLAHRWPRSEQLVLPHVGHAPHLSCPQAVATRIRQFMTAE